MSDFADIAFLPSTFTMYTTTLASAYAFELPAANRKRRTLCATTIFALGALLGWPFAIALAIPFIFEELFILGADNVQTSQQASWQMSRLLRLVRCGLLASSLLVRSIIATSL